LGAEALRRLAEAPLSEQQRFLLGECVEAYLPLSEAQQREYQRLISGESHAKVQAMNQTTYEKGIEKGIEKGREQGLEEGLQNTLIHLGRKRFGIPSREIKAKVLSIQDIARLEQLTERILDVQSWQELLETP